MAEHLSKPAVAVVTIIVVSFAAETIRCIDRSSRAMPPQRTISTGRKQTVESTRQTRGSHRGIYEQALRTLSYNSMLRQELAYELQVIGNDDEAAVQLRKVISINRGGNGDDFDAEVHIDLARILEKKGDLAGALKDCRLAEEINPDAYFYHTECERLLSRSRP